MWADNKNVEKCTFIGAEVIRGGGSLWSILASPNRKSPVYRGQSLGFDGTRGKKWEELRLLGITHGCTGCGRGLWGKGPCREGILPRCDKQYLHRGGLSYNQLLCHASEKRFLIDQISVYYIYPLKSTVN